MKTMKIMIVFISLLVIYACNDELPDGIKNSEDISKLITFVNPSTVNLTPLGAPFGSTVGTELFVIYIDRRPECKFLLGYCGREKFPWEGMGAPDVKSCEPNEECRDIAFQIAWDSNNNVHSATFLLQGDISHFPSNEQEFWVDATYTYPYDGMPLDSISIPSQTISRDATLGTYGGYILQLNGIINP